MKVVLATWFPEDPAAPRGGVEAVSVNLVRALSALPAVEVHVVTLGGKEGTSRWEGASIHRLPAGEGSVLRNALGPWRKAVCGAATRLAPDLVHAHDTFGLMVRGLGIPRVFTIHGFIHGDTLVSGERFARIRSRIWKAVEERGWAEQPHIISISPYVRERLAGIAGGMIHDIDNPIAPEFFSVPREEREGTIFSAALVSPRKNTLSLVEAFARVLAAGLPARLRLAGSVPEPAYGEQVSRRIRELGIEKEVDLLGRIDSATVREELSRASVFALVSLEENSPMGIEEAMAVGVPVVTSNRCGMPYMVRDGESGHLVDPSDPSEIAHRLVEILRDDEARKRMGEEGRRIALDRFHPDVVARRTLAVYRDVVRRGAGGG